MMKDGVMHACLLDGQGRGVELEREALGRWRPEQGSLWVHLGPGSNAWLMGESGLKPNQAAFLLQEKGRPRLVFHPGGFLITLCGVDPAGEPGEMLFLNAWVESRRILTFQSRPMEAVVRLEQENQDGVGAVESADVLLRLIEHLILEIGPLLDDLNGRLDLLEGDLSLARQQTIRKELGEVRRLVIRLHLHLEPQRTMLEALLRHREGAGEPREDKKTLQEMVEQMAGYLERLNAIREHTGVIRDELDSLVAQQMNQALYILSLISGLLLPMGLLTGLLGINVGGMPGVGDPRAFWAVCGLLAGIGAGMGWLFRRLRFI